MSVLRLRLSRLLTCSVLGPPEVQQPGHSFCSRLLTTTFVFYATASDSTVSFSTSWPVKARAGASSRAGS